jgi:hypothetical protein
MKSDIVDKPCCSETANCKVVDSEKKCDSDNGLCCLQCAKLYYAIFQRNAGITAFNYHLDNFYVSDSSFDDFTKHESSRPVKKPPGKINLHLTIQSTVLRC